MSSQRYDSDRSKSCERKSLQREQINLLLYKNSQLQPNKSKESAFSKTITISRNKAKSSQGSYRDFDPKKHSVDLIPPETKVSLSNWVENGLRFEPSTKRREKITRAHFNYVCVIGRGGFGKVWKVEDKKTLKVYALKEMSKAV